MLPVRQADGGGGSTAKRAKKGEESPKATVQVVADEAPVAQARARSPTKDVPASPSEASPAPKAARNGRGGRKKAVVKYTLSSDDDSDSGMMSLSERLAAKSNQAVAMSSDDGDDYMAPVVTKKAPAKVCAI